MTLAEIHADFALLDDWEDRYRFIIELGRELPPLPSEVKTEANKVRGCVSQVWLVSEVEDRGKGRSPVLKFRGDSDAHIVRGLIALLFALYQGRSAQETLAIDPAADFAALDLKEHLTPQRSNGLAAMVERIRSEARKALAEEARVG